MDNQKIEDKKQQKTYTAEEFVKAYNELCERYKYTLAPSLQWILRDDGTFSTKVDFVIKKTM